MTVFASKIDSPRDPRQPWEMTGQEYLADNYTGSISSGAYDSYADSKGLDWVKYEKFGILIDTLNINGQPVEIRAKQEKNKYVKHDENDEIVRDQKGMALYLTDEEIQSKGYSLEEFTIAAFANKIPVGIASDEWGASGVWVVKDFQRQGLGIRLLEELHRLNPRLAKNRLGQMTNAGWNMTKAYHKRLVQKALQEGKSVPQNVLQEYPEFANQKQSMVTYFELEKIADRLTIAPNVYPEDRPILKDSDYVRVFHGFRDMEDAIAACRYGISGKSRVGRVYSYEADNNPTGLFVTTNPKAAAEFGEVIIEFHAKGTELEAPVWPGGSYTVQGQMAQYFGNNKAKREEARQLARQRAIERGFDPISKSDRPELANTLMAFGENQALFIGHLNPNRITRVWLRGNRGELHVLSRRDFLVKKKGHIFSQKSGKDAWQASHRAFRVDEDFNPDKLVQWLSSKYGNRWSFDEAKKILVRALGAKDLYTMKYELLKYVWPKQLPAALRWLGREYRATNKLTP